MSRNDKLSKKAEVLPATKNDDVRHVMPLVDVYENDNEILLVSDMPGVTKDSLDIRIENDKMTISGRQSTDSNPALSREYEPKVFERTFALPQTIDTAKVTAELTRGELTVHLPKSASSRTRQIKVTAG